MKTRTIKLTLEYDGSAYGGWQRQPHSPTVQGEVERAIRAFDPELEHVQVAGRTDSGVHAIGQVAHFHTQISLEARRIAPAINYHLPNDIVVHRAEDMPEDFNARYDSLWKRYRYRIYNGPQETALHRTTSWWIRAPLEIEAMREAAAHFWEKTTLTHFARCIAMRNTPIVKCFRSRLTESSDHQWASSSISSFMPTHSAGICAGFSLERWQRSGWGNLRRTIFLGLWPQETDAAEEEPHRRVV